ncbi:MAG: tyrosine/phenylalanine carboxypeptidase domain-containing protein [Candidatus Peregrinibacteria bacterium]
MFFKNKGILGINARNLLYIRPYNKKKEIKLADDKIKTKQFLAARDIPVPKLYGIIRTIEEFEKFDFNTLPSKFVVKPNHGYGGEGIIPIVGKKDGEWITAGGGKINKIELKDHIMDILDGRFSISNIGDSAFFEQYIESDERVGKYSYEGLPDIRVVVHNLIPVMAMLRLPTKESKGKANLHQGAVGVGIDIAKGETTHIAYKNRIIDELPDGLGKIKGIKIPYWNEILLIASKTQLITNLGYLAADIGIDKNSGPVVLELNARAGLGVQIANLAPLRRRLERIEGVKVTSPTKGVRIAKDMFGNTLEKEIAQLSGKEVVSAEEEIEVIQKKGVFKILGKMDTGEERSTIDEETALRAGLLENTKDYDDEKSTLKLKFAIRNKRIQTVVDVEKIPSKKYKMIVGSRDLQDFLVDASQITGKTNKKETKIKQEETAPVHGKINFHEIDQQLLQIDNKLKLLYHLRPTNLESEREKFFKNPSQNPQLEYPKLKFDPMELIDKLGKIETDDSPLGKIFEEKKHEISNKIDLLEAIGEENFTEISIKLFGRPNEVEVDMCDKMLKEMDISSIQKEPALYGAEDAKTAFEEVFKKYGLKEWKVKIKESMVADCVAGKNNRLFIHKDAAFTNERIKSLIVHEIETHILTAENGKNQPYEIFNRGLSDYLITQEGLAIYNVEKQRHTPLSYKALIQVIALDQALKGSFVEIFDRIMEYGLSKELAYRAALKSKRGLFDTGKSGAFTKDFIYFRGYREVSEFVEKGGNLKDLYIGKFNIKDFEKIKNIPGIVEPRILPEWIKK